MSALAPSLTCTQCGSPLSPQPGQVFLKCPSCGTAVFIDKTQVVLHYSLEPTINEQQARGRLNQWMAGNQTVKDLDQKAQVTSVEFAFFPLWSFKRQENGRESIVLEPAAATSVPDLKTLTLPAGDLKLYDSRLDGQAIEPTVPLDAALTWLRQRGLNVDQINERLLVHLPVYTFKYTFNGETYTALVEGATGRVLASLFPAKAEAPYMLAGCATALVFLALGLIPVIGLVSGDGTSIAISLVACGLLGVVAAVPLFAFASWVAAKV